ALVGLAARLPAARRSGIAQLGICEMSVRKLRSAPFSSGHIAYPARVIGNYFLPVFIFFKYIK
ncbi:MAG: hypothetical protein Q8P07_05660, partial [bacterium]|nr:hypothetical protein [bacterium]